MITLDLIRISQIHKTTAEWTECQEILKVGEIGYDSDVKKFKFGDGVKTFDQLPWAAMTPTEITNLVNAHTSNYSNPHKVTKDQVGLGKVENKSVSEILTDAALTGTPTAPTAAPGTNTTQIATTQFVTNAISNGIAASDAMIFKGTLGTDGTVEALPTTYSTGWTYRVIEAGTYAGQECEIGDLVIALTSRSGSGNQDADWTVAQTNIDGAITDIKSTASVSVTGTGSSRTIELPASGVTAGAYRNVTVNDKGIVTGGNNNTATIAEGGTNNTTFDADTVIVFDGTKLSSSTISTEKLGYLSDVTSNIQAQLNGKAASNHTHNYAASATPGGAANSVANKLTIQANGTEFKTFNGSAATLVNIKAGQNITITPNAETNAIEIKSSFTDTKVTNTLDASSKFYVTGTTSATTGTGTQVFNTSIYGQGDTFFAGKFEGKLAADNLIDGDEVVFLNCTI